MSDLPVAQNATTEKIYKTYVKNNGDWRRDHLGASLIGQECERKIWYTFRWCTNPEFNGRMLRLFATGHSQESRLLRDLKNIGIVVYDVDPDTGNQIHYKDFGGYYAGSLDAIAKGFDEAPKTWHVVECKTMNTKSFTYLKSKGVRIAKYEHYAQMQVYMGWSGLDRAMYLVVCKDTDEIYSERVYFDKETYDRLRLKADRIVFADVPMQKIGGPDSFKCKWCEHRYLCHDKKLPEVNCRTCAHSDIVENGWVCGKDNHTLEPLEQRQPHPCHVFIPALVPMEQTDADAERGTITYGKITNGPGAISSTELQEWIQ